MVTLDVDFTFTNIPLEEIIDTWTETSFENDKRVDGLSKIELKELLSFS